MIVAITGRSGSGKSYIAAHYQSLGYFVIDADATAREVLDKDNLLLAELAKEFGNDIIDESGNLLRRKLSDRAFKNDVSACRLSKITHPHIIKRILELVNESKSNPVFVDGAVIVGELFEQYCDVIIVVTAPHEEAVQRITQRDNIPRAAAENRLAAQMPEHLLKEKADYIIVNNSGKEALLKESEKVLKALQTRF